MFQYKRNALNVFRFLAMLLLFVLPFSLLAQDGPKVNVMTFNIRFPNPDDGFDYWPKRKELVASMIRFHEADLVGVQEAFRSQLDELTQMLPNFKWVGVCRTDGSRNPDPDNEFSAILYNKDKFELIEDHTFWLSETPEEKASKGWDAALPRIVTWAQFEHKASGRRLYHFNTHFDHVGQEARKNSAALILDQIKSNVGDEPLVLTGDFNCIPADIPYRVLTDEQNDERVYDAYFISKTPHHGPASTWTAGFRFPGVPDRRIDYIFIKNNVEVLRHGILSESWSGRLPSDHLPVLATIRF